jgi:23S rRNA pseudouridine2605 synthase
MKERIQKIIANAGITSRRKAEELIRQGRVTIDGHTIEALGSLADISQEKLRVDGKLVAGKPENLYILLYKPKRYITTLDDPQQRPCVLNLVKGIKARIFPVGRLDYDAEGLLLLTNDGALTQKLLHPRYQIPRTYEVKVKGIPPDTAIRALRSGVRLSDGMTHPARVKFLEKTRKNNSWVGITVTEGRNKLIKRMFSAVGHPVLKLKRTRFGPFSLGKLKSGEYMVLSPAEIKKLITLL